MAVRTLPNLGLRAFYALGEDGWKDDMDLGLLKLSVLTQGVAINRVSALPGSPALGDVYILDETATGGNANKIAIRDGETGSVTWVFVTPNEGWLMYAATLDKYLTFNGTAWVDLVSGGGSAPTESIIVALGDETTVITTGTAKVTIRMPYAFVVTGVKASLTTASSSGIPTVDINEGGASILSTKLTIDAGEKTSATAATAAVISDANLAADAEITFDIDVAGTDAAGLKVYLIGHQ